jgi:exonuclease III
LSVWTAGGPSSNHPLHVTTIKELLLGWKDRSPLSVNCSGCSAQISTRVSSVSVVTCGRCQHSLYCTRQCQESDWLRHRDHCVLSSSTEISPTTLSGSRLLFSQTMHEIHTVAQQAQQAKCTSVTWDPVFTSSVDQAVDGGACPGDAAHSVAGGEREAPERTIDLAETSQIPHILVVPDLLENHSRIEAFISQADQVCCSSAESPPDTSRPTPVTCDPCISPETDTNRSDEISESTTLVPDGVSSISCDNPSNHGIPLSGTGAPSSFGLLGNYRPDGPKDGVAMLSLVSLNLAGAAVLSSSNMVGVRAFVTGVNTLINNHRATCVALQDLYLVKSDTSWLYKTLRDEFAQIGYRFMLSSFTRQEQLDPKMKTRGRGVALVIPSSYLVPNSIECDDSGYWISCLMRCGSATNVRVVSAYSPGHDTFTNRGIRIQLNKILTGLVNRPEPIVVCSDSNSVIDEKMDTMLGSYKNPKSALVTHLIEKCGLIDSFRLALPASRLYSRVRQQLVSGKIHVSGSRIDHIMVSPRLLEGRALSCRIDGQFNVLQSDHFAIVCSLDFEAEDFEQYRRSLIDMPTAPAWQRFISSCLLADEQREREGDLYDETKHPAYKLKSEMEKQDSDWHKIITEMDVIHSECLGTPTRTTRSKLDVVGEKLMSLIAGAGTAAKLQSSPKTLGREKEVDRGLEADDEEESAHHRQPPEVKASFEGVHEVRREIQTGMLKLKRILTNLDRLGAVLHTMGPDSSVDAKLEPLPPPPSHRSFDYTDQFGPPSENSVLIFGSNTEGRHGKGAALLARSQYGAQPRIAKGRTGMSYAVMCKDLSLGTRSVDLLVIKRQFDALWEHIHSHPELIFYMAPVACVNGGYTVNEVAACLPYGPLPRNLVLNSQFLEFISANRNSQDLEIGPDPLPPRAQLQQQIIGLIALYSAKKGEICSLVSGLKETVAACREASESSHCASRKGQSYTDSILLPWVKKLEEYTELIDGNKIPDLHPLGHSDVKTCLFQFQAEEKLAATEMDTDHLDSGTHLAFT